MYAVIGIDLGTTNCTVAFLTPESPEIIPNALGLRLKPSVVGVDDSDSVVAEADASQLQIVLQDRCALLFKRYMGTEKTVSLGEKSFHARGALESRTSDFKGPR